MKRWVLFSLWIVLGSKAFAQLDNHINASAANARFFGLKQGDKLGHHVSFIGDIDKDGYDDFLITSPGRDKDEFSEDVGAVYLFYGKASGWKGTINLNTADAQFLGSFPGNEASHDSYGIGDVDDDGYPDFAISIKKYSLDIDGELEPKLGKVYLFFGGNSRYNGTINLEDAPASIYGINPRAEAAHVKEVGDIDGDRVDDIIIGAGFHSQVGPEAGKVYIIFGKARRHWLKSEDIENAADASYVAEAEYDWAGHRVSAVGDINGDKLYDFIVGANNFDHNDNPNSGKTYLILGRDRSRFRSNRSLQNVDASWVGLSKQGLGWNVANVGDVNDGGRPDFITSGKKNTFYLILGENISYRNNQDIEQAADVIFTHEGTVWDDIGHDIYEMGDYNKDGYDDFIIGSSLVDDDQLGKGTGKAYIFYGRGSWPATMTMNQADVIITGEGADDGFGFSVSQGGDVDNDGVHDILISALNPNDETTTGKAYLFLSEPPTLSLLSPNGGEVLSIGVQEQIRWIQDPNVQSVDLDYSIDNGATWISIASQISNSGNYTWTVPPPESEQCLVRVQDAADGNPEDLSDSVFSIRDNRSIQVTAPNGGEVLTAGSNYSIQWNSQNLTDQIVIELSIDGGLTWDAVQAHGDNSGQFLWEVPDRASSDCLIRISGSPSTSVSDSSDAFFTIQGSNKPRYRIEAETLTLTSSMQSVNNAAASNGKVAQLKTANTSGSLSLTVDLPPAIYRLFVRYADETGGESQARAFLNGSEFSRWQWDQAVQTDVFVYHDLNTMEIHIADELELQIEGDRSELAKVDYLEFVKVDELPTLITVIQPNGGETWTIGSTYPITWTSNNIDQSILIQQSRDGGLTWMPIVANIANTGEYNWTIEGLPSENALVKVSTMDQSISDISDAAFTIEAEPNISLTTPNGGEKWTIDEQETIVWASTNTSGRVTIELSRDNGQSWESLANNINDSGSFPWTVTQPAANACLMRITDPAGPASDQSDASFTIAEPLDPILTLLAPDGGESWAIGDTTEIRWFSQDILDSIRIELSRNNGDTWETIKIVNPSNSLYLWRVIGPESDSCLIKISSAMAGLQDTSVRSFTIFQPKYPEITVLSPNGGESWHLEIEQTLHWESKDIEDGIRIELSRDLGINWETLAAAAANTGAFTWKVTGPTSKECLIKMSSQDSSASDISDALFTIYRTLHPKLTLTSPVGGEFWTIGTRVNITWTSEDVTDSVRVELSRNGGATWEILDDNVADTGLFRWLVVGPPSQDCLIKISTQDRAAETVSAESFMIDDAPEPVLTVISPNGGEQWSFGSLQTIRWFSQDIKDSLTIELSRNGGVTWEILGIKSIESTSLTWTVVEPASETCLVRVKTLDETHHDISDEAFTIYQKLHPVLDLKVPNGGEIWAIDNRQQIQWTSSDVNDGINIQLSRDGGANWQSIVEATANTGSFNWQVGGPPSTACLLLITTLNGAAADTSDTTFTIQESHQPNITVLSPNGGESWSIGLDKDIRWSSVDVSSAVRIELSRDDGQTYEVIADQLENTGAYTWTVTAPPSSQCRIKISDIDSTVSDVSNFSFTISPTPVISIQSPNGNETWQVGTQQDFTWASANTSGHVKIQLSRNNGITWETIAENEPDSGMFSWTVTEPPSEECLALISDSDGLPVDISNGNFHITAVPTLTLVEPNGNEVWLVGENRTIRWDSENVPDGLKIELSRDNGSSWSTLVENVPNTGSWQWTVDEPVCELALINISSPQRSLTDQNDAPFSIDYPAGVAQIDHNAPDHFSLQQNYPNPFNPETRITYQLAKPVEVRLAVYNVHGHHITTLVDADQSPGTYLVTWNGNDERGQSVPSGVYFYRIVAGEFTAGKRLIFMK